MQERCGLMIKNSYVAYVDGSYMHKVVGYGAVILKDDEHLVTLSGATDKKEYTKSFQVGGEIAAVISALRWLSEQKIGSVSIYYDFANLEKWATGEYQAKAPIAIAFCKQLEELAIEIDWHKVAAHTGDKWNELADLTAKNAIKTFCQARGGAIDVCGENDVPSGNDGLSVKEMELVAFVEEYVSRLAYENIEGCFKKISNGHTAVISVMSGGKKYGHIYIYNTDKKAFTSSTHDIKDVACATKLLGILNCLKNDIIAGDFDLMPNIDN
jgi:ribonuclease HI